MSHVGEKEGLVFGSRLKGAETSGKELPLCSRLPGCLFSPQLHVLARNAGLCILHNLVMSSKQAIFAFMDFVGEEFKQDTVGTACICPSLVWDLSWGSSTRLVAGVVQRPLTHLSGG